MKVEGKLTSPRGKGFIRLPASSLLHFPELQRPLPAFQGQRHGGRISVQSRTLLMAFAMFPERQKLPLALCSCACSFGRASRNSGTAVWAMVAAGAAQRLGVCAGSSDGEILADVL